MQHAPVGEVFSVVNRIKGATLDDTNTITDPKHVIPVTSNLTGISKTFNHTFDPYSVTVVKISTGK